MALLALIADDVLGNVRDKAPGGDAIYAFDVIDRDRNQLSSPIKATGFTHLIRWQMLAEDLAKHSLSSRHPGEGRDPRQRRSSWIIK